MRHGKVLPRLLILTTASLVCGQEVPDAIVAEGVPAIPPGLSKALARYQDARPSAFQGWFGTCREILLTARAGATNQVHHVGVPGGPQTRWTSHADRVLEAIPRPGRDAFLYAADEGGGENVQLFLHDSRTGDARRVSDGRSRHVSARWSRAGDRIAFSNNARNGKDMDPYILDPADPKSLRRLAEVVGDWSIADWSPDGRRVAALEYRSVNETYVYLFDVTSGARKAITPRPPAGGTTAAYADVRWSPDGKALYWTTDRGSQFRRLERFDLDTGAGRTLTGSIPWDVEAFDLSDDGTRIVLSANEDGRSRLHVLDAEGREQPALPLPEGQVTGLKFRPGSLEFGFSLSTARHAGDVFSHDLATAVQSRWTRGEVAGLDPETLSEPKRIRYPSFDGREIPALVYHPGPRFPGRRPVLIDIHGGPASQARPGFLGRGNAWVEELGIALILPNVRGSSGYGRSYLTLDDGRHREDSVRDIGALLDWIAAQPDLDPDHVAVMGASYGGYMTLASLTRYGGRLKAGIDVVGISNFVSFLENTKAYRRDLRRVEYGDERDPGMRAFLEAISPLSSAESIRVPLLVAHGKNDPRVPAAESSRIAARVRRNGTPVWYVVASNEGHGFAKKKNQNYLHALEFLFLRRYLVGDAS